MYLISKLQPGKLFLKKSEERTMAVVVVFSCTHSQQYWLHYLDCSSLLVMKKLSLHTFVCGEGFFLMWKTSKIILLENSRKIKKVYSHTAIKGLVFGDFKCSSLGRQQGVIKFWAVGTFTLDKPFRIQILSAVILNIIFRVLLCEIENLF